MWKYGARIQPQSLTCCQPHLKVSASEAHFLHRKLGTDTDMELLYDEEHTHMHLCVYICKHVYVYMHTLCAQAYAVHMCTHLHNVHTCMCTHIYMCIYTHICAHTYIRKNA